MKQADRIVTILQEMKDEIKPVSVMAKEKSDALQYAIECIYVNAEDMTKEYQRGYEKGVIDGQAKAFQVKKLKVIAHPKLSFGNDGRDSHYVIEYSCPTCGRIIGCEYKGSNACDECGTFYDWGEKKPKLMTEVFVDWG